MAHEEEEELFALLDALDNLARDDDNVVRTKIPARVFERTTQASDWMYETADFFTLEEIARPRLSLLIQTWSARLDLMLLAAREGSEQVERMRDLFWRVRERTVQDYHFLRARFLDSKTAAGLGQMTPVQRSIFYSSWLTSLVARALLVIFDARKRGEADCLDLSALDFSYVPAMAMASQLPIAIMGDSPLREYTLPYCATALEALIRAMDKHGNPTADPSLGEYWSALWTRMAQILAGDWTEDERKSSLFLDIYGCTGAANREDIDHGRLVHPLPLVSGTRRLRIVALERLEIQHYAWQAVLDAHERFERAAKNPLAVGLSEEFRERLPAHVGDILTAWKRFFKRHEEQAGSAMDRYNRERFYKLLGPVHLRPGENELFYVHAIERDASSPPMEIAPDAAEVVYTFRGDDYTQFSKGYEGSPYVRVQRDYLEGADAGAIAAKKGERLGLLYVAIWLDGHALLKELPLHLLPTAATYWGELLQHEQTGVVLPPKSPEEALSRYSARTTTAENPTGMKCTWVRLLRRHYILISAPDGSPITMELGLGGGALGLLSSLLVWMAACPASVFALDNQVPPELRGMVNALRTRRGGGSVT